MKRKRGYVRGEEQNLPRPLHTQQTIQAKVEGVLMARYHLSKAQIDGGDLLPSQSSPASLLPPRLTRKQQQQQQRVDGGSDNNSLPLSL